MGRYHHDFEPSGSGGKKPLPPHKRTTIAYFILAGVALIASFVLPFLGKIL